MFFAAATAALRLKGALAVLVCACFVFVSVPGLIGTLTGYVTAGGKDASVSTRTSDYATTAPYVRQSPWVGRGPGTFFPPKHTLLDNQYLGTLIETGTVGLVATMTFFLAPVVLGRGARRRCTSEGDRFLGQMLAASALGFTFAAATFDALSFPTCARSAALVLGLSGAWWMWAREQAGEIPAADPLPTAAARIDAVQPSRTGRRAADASAVHAGRST
jgi:O-antigen ligase